jgi:outer membrane lipoprotein LolB
VKIFQFALLLTIISVVSSCATLPAPQKENDAQSLANWNTREQQIRTIDRWLLSGRFSAKSDNEAWNGALTWQQTRDDYAIRISGPLNQGSAELTGNDRYARLSVSAKETWEDQDAESILRKHLGFALPVKELRYWILGVPAPGPVSRFELDADGTVLQFRQNGWIVKFKNYVIVEQVQLPGKLFIEQKEFEFRLVLDQWQLKS